MIEGQRVAIQELVQLGMDKKYATYIGSKFFEFELRILSMETEIGNLNGDIEDLTKKIKSVEKSSTRK